MAEGLKTYWYQGVDALLKGDEALAQDIWMSAMLECRVDEVKDRTAELVAVLENTAIELLQAGNWNGSKKCYEMALEADQSFENVTLKKFFLAGNIYSTLQKSEI
ncbi:hypothetical protein NON20_13490 [Synechocystis sp. B12]|nr:hypothetical protein NON20_13490 [Synechocystis sp. B12]